MTAFDRTVGWFASDDYRMDPDRVVLAKGITSGHLSLGAVPADEEIGGAIVGRGGFHHVFTYFGHPVASAIAPAKIRILKAEELPAAAVRKETPLLDEFAPLRDYPLVGEVRGKGLEFLPRTEIPGHRATVRPGAGVFAAAGDHGGRDRASGRRGRGAMSRREVHPALIPPTHRLRAIENGFHRIHRRSTATRPGERLLFDWERVNAYEKRTVFENAVRVVEVRRAEIADLIIAVAGRTARKAASEIGLAVAVGPIVDTETWCSVAGVDLRRGRLALRVAQRGGGRDSGHRRLCPRHLVPRVLAFAGLTEVGRHVAEAAARDFKKAILELGDNGAFILCEDVDLDLAAMFSRFADQS